MNTRMLILPLAIYAMVCGCAYQHPTDQVAVLVDITDTHILRPDTHAIRDQFSLSSNRWAGAIFSVAPITDVGYNQYHEYTIASTSPLTANIAERNREVGQFWHSYASAWNLLNDTAGRERSSVYLSIARELHRLVHSPATRKTLEVYSDLQEHTSAFSVHDRKDFALLKSDPDAVMDRLAAIEDLPPSLQGITIHLIYAPLCPADDERFTLMAHMLRDAFTSRGASVTISGSLHLAHH